MTADNDADSKNDNNNDDGDGDEAFGLHSSMCAHECALHALYLQYHWPTLLTQMASCIGRYHWSAQLAGIIGQGPWQHVPNTSVMTMLMMLMMMIMTTMTIMIMMLIMIMMMMMVMGMMVMGMMNSNYIPTCACMSVHTAQHTCQVGQREVDSTTGQHHWPAQLASTINTTGQQHWPAAMV
jgi:hypothetical protein